jgi:nitroreductase
MDALQAILTRRSIRQYTPEPVKIELVDELLHAAMSAPSAGNQQPWQFVIITERQKLDAIPVFHPHADMVRLASAAVLVCGDMRLEKNKGYWVQDCSAATQNLLLAAHAHGLGAVWVGIYPREERVQEFRKLLAIPEEVVPFALVPIGYPAEAKPPSNRYNPTRVHINHYGS